MSLQDKKSALFGGAKGSSGAKSTPSAPASSAPAASTAPAPPKPIAVSASTTPSSQITTQQKAKKVAEAKEFSEKGMKAITTTLFQWSADYLSAASYFESSANAYFAAVEYDMARLMYLKAAECHEKAKCDSAAAVATAKAAQMAQQMGNKELASQHFIQTAECWGVGGDLVKMAESLSKAAVEIEALKPDDAIALQKRACDVLLPPNTSKESMKQSHYSVLETFRTYFRMAINRYIANSKSMKLEDLLRLANVMVNLFEALEIESSLHKMLLTITVLQLSAGDVVLADRTYLQDHLNVTNYMKTKECEVAEEMIQAFKNYDVDRLEAAQRLPQVNYLDKEVQQLAKKLSLFKAKDNSPAPSAAPAAAPSTSAAANKLFSGAKTSTPSAPAPVPAPASDDQSPLNTVTKDIAPAVPEETQAQEEVDEFADDTEAEVPVAPAPAPAPLPVRAPVPVDDEDEIDLS